MRVVKERANAKINLFLDVISKRDDGFHDIKTVMHSVSLCDDITIKYIPGAATSVRMIADGVRYMPTDEKNLAVRAALLYLESAGLKAYVEIKLEKRIPIAAGLAGGSSDAAAVLRGMNRLTGKYFSEKALYKLAEALGSDVPYCLYGKTALCEGRGERITKLPDSLSLNAVLAISNERVSTPQAYMKLDGVYSDFDGTVMTEGEKHYQSLIEELPSGSVSEASLFNVFEEAVLVDCTGAKEIKKRLSALGASCTLMSGSGPCVFGLFDTIDAAKKASEILKSEGITAFAVSSV